MKKTYLFNYSSVQSGKKKQIEQLEQDSNKKEQRKKMQRRRGLGNEKTIHTQRRNRQRSSVALGPDLSNPKICRRQGVESVPHSIQSPADRLPSQH